MKNFVLFALCLPFLFLSFSEKEPPEDHLSKQAPTVTAPPNFAASWLEVLYLGSNLSPEPYKVTDEVRSWDEDIRKSLVLACQHIQVQVEAKALAETEIMKRQQGLQDEIAHRLRMRGIDPNSNQTPLQMTPNASVYLWAYEMECVLKNETRWENTISSQLVQQFFQKIEILEFTIQMTEDWETRKMLDDLMEWAKQDYASAVGRNYQEIIAPLFQG